MGEASGIPQSEKMTPMIGPRTTGLRKERPIASTMAPAPLLPEAAALFASRIPRVSGDKKIEPTAMDRATETMFPGPNTAAISGSPAAALFGKAIVKAWIAASPDGRRRGDAAWRRRPHKGAGKRRETSQRAAIAKARPRWSCRHRNEERCRQGKIHDQRIQLSDVTVIDVSDPSGEIAKSHDGEDRHQGVEQDIDHGERPRSPAHRRTGSWPAGRRSLRGSGAGRRRRHARQRHARASLERKPRPATGTRRPPRWRTDPLGAAAMQKVGVTY